MANIKFSQFTAEADINNFDDIVGYAGAVNTRITPANLASSLITLSGGPYLPIAAGVGNPLTGDLYIGDGTAPAVDLFLNTTGAAGDETQIRSQGEQFMYHEKGTDFKIGPNDDIAIDDSGSAGISMSSVTTFVSDIKDVSNSAGNNGFILKSNGGAGAGVSWRQEQPGCQLKIAGTSGLSNTTDGIDFEVPYNATIVNDDTTIFNPQLIGGGGANIGIEVLQSGRYEFFARYSTFDIIQSGLPNVDGTKFLRIVAAVNGVKQCILQDLIVPTALNGEANVTGGGFMDLSAGDIFGIIGFHTGATGGAGNQGFNCVISPLNIESL